MAERITLEYEDSPYSWPTNLPSYGQIVETFGEIVAEAEDDDYQGDSLYLVLKDGQYGVLTFGWGSCSGCDALEAVSGQKDLDELQDDLERGIRWYDTADEVLSSVNRDGYMEGSYLNDQLLRDFREAVNNALNNKED